MKKRTYKRLQKLLYKEKLARLRAEDELKHVMYRIEQAEDEAKSLRKRFAEFGTNVNTSDTGNTAVRCVKWTLNPVAYGTYMAFIDDIKADTEKRIKEKLIESLIRGLSRATWFSSFTDRHVIRRLLSLGRLRRNCTLCLGNKCLTDARQFNSKSTSSNRLPPLSLQTDHLRLHGKL